MAGNAGIMLRKAQLMKKKERAQRATEALLDVVKLVSSDHDIHELVDGIIQAAYQLLQADMVTLFLVDPIKQELWMAVSKVRATPVCAAAKGGRGGGMCTHADRTRVC